MKKITIGIISLVILSANSYSFASCNTKLNLTKLKDVKVYRCDDNTISHSQPSNTKYEGLCGPTAVANAFHAFCDGNIVDPKALSEKYFWDITPGVRPDVLKSGLNKVFKNNKECITGNWKYYYSKNRWNFLDSLYSRVRKRVGTLERITENGTKAIRSPILVLTKASGNNLHWVTVVDVIGYKPGSALEEYKRATCKVIYNDSGRQTSELCSRFVQRANEIDNAWYTDLVLPEYVHLVFEKSMGLSEMLRQVMN